jgi:glycosyl-4,4'-diaponeurosporenoate acyltransferase
MRVIYLPLFWTLVLDSLAWSILQPGIAYLSLRFPHSWLKPERWLYRPRPWERGGHLYQELFKVQRWKSRLPSGGTLFGGFSMSHIASRNPDYLEAWVVETCRAELCHWLAILPALLFFLWNPPWLGLIMVAYAVAFNAVPIITQRHNRPRLLALLRRMERRGTALAEGGTG